MAGPRPTAIHFTLVFCVLLTLGLGAATWTLFVEYAEQEKALQAATRAREIAGNTVTDLDAQILEIKTRLGYDLQEIGVTPDGNPPPTTVLRAIYDDLRTNEGILVGQNVADALRAMRAEIDRLQQIADTYTSEIARINERYTAVQTGIGDRTAEIAESQEGSAARLQQMIAAHDRLVQQKQSTINQLRSETTRETTEKESLRDELNRVQMDTDNKVAEREQRIEALNLELEDIRQVSFERADGAIVSVDNTRQEVYINLGSADLLTEQVTFSVYVQNHNGIGRGVHDVKGAIEVTRILGPHQAVARITWDDITRPMTPGDPIFSPIWQSGVSEQFAFVGIIDFDGDGIGDWEKLIERIEHAGSRVQFYIDDQGNMQPPGAAMSVQTKYLVEGKILDQNDYPGLDDMQTIAANMQRHHLEQTSATLRYGVKIVTAEEFLTYVGYRPLEYHWVPGEQREFRFRGGSTPPPTARDIFGQDATRNESEGLTDEGGFYDETP
jgi:hypothetical protein